MDKQQARDIVEITFETPFDKARLSSTSLRDEVTG